MTFIKTTPITITNILKEKPEIIANFINVNILNTYLPAYTANSEIDVKHDIIPRLSKYSNDKAYVTSLYLVVCSALYEQKKFRRIKSDLRDEETFTDLEAKAEILYRTLQAIDRMYEASSRLMTGVGSPDPRMSRHG